MSASGNQSPDKEAPPPEVTLLEESPPTLVESDAPMLPGRALFPGGVNTGSLVSVPPTKVDESGLAAGGRFLEYELIEPMRVTSAEADLWLIRSLDKQETRVLKLYRYGIEPKPEILEAIRDLRRSDLVGLIDHGVQADRHYEIQEYLPMGSLRDLLAQQKLGPMQARQVLGSLSEVVHHLHAVNIIHRDIKPSNILVREQTPLNLVLTDFGISSITELSLHLTTVHRTAAYSAPEALTGVTAKASDWWSIGVIVLELLTGRHPFAGLNEQAVNFQLVSKGITVPDGLESGWRLLLTGLLTRNHRARWGWSQVNAWLKGDRDIAVEEAGPITDAGPSQRPYHFNNHDYYTPEELALALAEDWEEGVKHFCRGLVLDWVRDHVVDQQLTSRLIDIMEDRQLDGDEQLAAAILAMHPNMPLTVRGEIITPEWFPSHAQTGVELLRGALPRYHEKFREETWLADLRRQRSAAMRQIKQTGLTIDTKLADSLLLSSPPAVIETARQERQKYVIAMRPDLSEWLQKDILEFWEAVAFLTCDRVDLLTREELEKRQLDHFRDSIIRRFKKHKIAYSDKRIDELLDLGAEKTKAAALRLKRKYPRASQRIIDELLKKRELNYGESIAVLSCDKNILLNKAAARKLLLNEERELFKDEISELGIEFDWEKLNWLMDNPEDVTPLLDDYHRRYTRITHPLLEELFEADELDMRHALILAAAHQRYFLSPWGEVLGSVIRWGSAGLSFCRRYPISICSGACVVSTVAFFVVPPHAQFWVFAAFTAFLSFYVAAWASAPPVEPQRSSRIKRKAKPQLESPRQAPKEPPTQ